MLFFSFCKWAQYFKANNIKQYQLIFICGSKYFTFCFILVALVEAVLLEQY